VTLVVVPTTPQLLIVVVADHVFAGFVSANNGPTMKSKFLVNFASATTSPAIVTMDCCVRDPITVCVIVVIVGARMDGRGRLAIVVTATIRVFRKRKTVFVRVMANVNVESACEYFFFVNYFKFYNQMVYSLY
jgi:hypothetical protein